MSPTLSNFDDDGDVMASGSVSGGRKRCWSSDDVVVALCGNAEFRPFYLNSCGYHEPTIFLLPLLQLSMASPRILRLARSDESHGVSILHVLHAGPEPLDLTLTATEGESPYTGTGTFPAESGPVYVVTNRWSVKQSQLNSFRYKNYQGTDEEWAQIVSLVLGQCAPTDEQTWPTGIEVSTSIIGSDDEHKELVISIRKRVEDITVLTPLNPGSMCIF